MTFKSKSKSELEILLSKKCDEKYIKRSKTFLASRMTTREHIATTILSSMVVEHFPDCNSDPSTACQMACNLADELMLTLAATDDSDEV